MKFLVLIGVCIVYAYATEVKPCQNSKRVDNLSSLIDVDRCTKPPCILKKDNSYAVHLKFTPDHDIKQLTNSISAKIGGIPFPFVGVDGTNACGNIYSTDGKTKLGCPLKGGQEYLYKNNIEVLAIYPRVKLVVHWALTSPKGDEICFEVPARITA